MPLSDIQMFFTSAFDKALATTTTPLELCRHTLQSAQAELYDRFDKGVPVSALVTHRAWIIDELLIRVWGRFMESGDHGIALVAVGGYGRGELHPCSDIDLLVLLAADETDHYRERIEKLLAFLWDIGLEVGHSVRSVDECVRQAEKDITVMTNLMESRLVAGNAALYEAMQQRTSTEHIWPARAFFEAKWQEQQARHHKYHDTAYNLEPNVKEGPGGLRDLQMISWVVKRHFSADTLGDLVGHHFLTQKEYRDLMECREFLWRVRYGLHVVTGRNENRLLFDHQQALARQFGYQDDHLRLGVEKFMKDYYRTITELSRLNEMLLQLFQEAILHADMPMERAPINKRFRACNGFIEVTSSGIFRRYPFALLEIFLLLQQSSGLKGVRAQTIRLIREHLHLIDDRFRDDLRCRTLFMEILRQPHGVTHELRRMNRYGILAAYLPPFAMIVGQMQYDLFHVYTVDDHTLHVIRNLRRFMISQYEDEYPLCSKISKRIPKPELLYLGALFHDIAKGRGGDHSELGEADAEAFCRHHGLGDYDTGMITWLVRNHLIMSVTAQHQDISDPEVVVSFARTVGDASHLDHLYLLTVADIRATNPALWNSWKDALLIDLYTATRRALQRGVENPVDIGEAVRDRQEAARALIADHDRAAIDRLWEHLDEDYFLRHSPDEVAWHTHAILTESGPDRPLVIVREETERGGTEIFLYTHDQDDLFAITTMALAQLGLDIVDARIITTRHGYTLDTYIVLDSTGRPIHSAAQGEEIASFLREAITQVDTRPTRVTRRAPRQLKHFSIPTEIAFSDDLHHRYTIAELITTDRPGLLAQIGQAFVECGVRVQNAKIATFGERVEDVFFITDRHDKPLARAEQFDALRDAIVRRLNERDQRH